VLRVVTTNVGDVLRRVNDSGISLLSGGSGGSKLSTTFWRKSMGKRKNASGAQVLRTSLLGLSVQHKEDGCWLQFTTGTGREAYVNLNAYADRRGGIVGDTIRRWIEDVRATPQRYHCPLDGERLVGIGLDAFMCQCCKTKFILALGSKSDEAGISWERDGQDRSLLPWLNSLGSSFSP